MPKLYLEQIQSDVWVAVDEDEMAEGVEFQPVYAFRNPIPGGIEVDVSDDVYNGRHAHVVVAYWFERFGEDDNEPIYHWHICGITDIRRKAVEIKIAFELGDKVGPWDEEDNSDLDEITIFSLKIED